MGDILSDLQCHLAFEEGTGTTAEDSTANNRDGTLTNGPTWVAGQIEDGAIQLDGTNDHVTVTGLDNFLGGKSAATAAFWFKPISGSIATGDLVVSVGLDLRILVGNSTLKRIRVDIRDGINPGQVVLETGNDGYVEDVWQHVVVSITSGNHEIWVNGVSKDTGTATFTVFDVDNDSPFLIGSATTPWPCQIDEFRLYNRAFTQGDVDDLFAYTGGAPPAAAAGPLIGGQLTRGFLIGGRLVR